MILETNTNRSGLKKKRKRKEDKYQDAGLVEKYKIKMKLVSPIKGFMSPMNRISSQKRCFIFCQRKQFINNLQQWTDLKPPDGIRADSLFTDDTVAACKDNGLPICNAADLSN